MRNWYRVLSTALILALIGLMLVPSVDARRKRYKDGRHTSSESTVYGLMGFSVDFEDDRLIIEKDGRREGRLEITREYDLFVNGRKIDLDEDQQYLVTDFYDLTQDITDEAVRLGKEGIRIGVDGASLGLKAVCKIFKLLSADYDTEDFEREIEYEARKIEKKAERLEKKAKRIERMAEELEDLAYEMDEEIPEIRELRWL